MKAVRDQPLELPAVEMAVRLAPVLVVRHLVHALAALARFAQRLFPDLGGPAATRARTM